MRLDAEKLEILRRWGDGLSREDRDETRSAGRAILLLIEEIERLHIDLWHARTGDVAGGAPEPAAAAQAHDEEVGAELAEELSTPLRDRLARWLP